jgi:hypothetical protein
MLTFLIGLSCLIFGIFLIKSGINSQDVNPNDTLRWKQKKEIYLIQRRFLFFFWETICFFTPTGEIKKLYFNIKSEAIRYVDVHNIKKRFNQKKL